LHVIEGNDREISERLLQPVTSRLFLFVMLPCLAYAGVRYHVVQGVPLAQAPLYILNKAISLGGLALLAMSFVVGKIAGLRWANRRIELVAIVPLVLRVVRNKSGG